MINSIDSEVFENVTVYIVTFPEGAGNSFMGYLQQVYGGDAGFEPLYVDKNISWSGKFKTGITIFNLFPMDSFLHPDVEGLKPTVIAPRVSIGGKEGDPSLAKKDLGWEPKTKFKDLVRIMVKNDYETLKHEQG